MKMMMTRAVALGLAFTAHAEMNILVLTVDDMNCDSIGVFGCTTPDTTPNIDAFAKEGFRFAHAHVHATSCIPSRNVVQTGRYLYNSGIEGFYQLPPEQVTYPTTPDILRKHGYFTMIRGKASHSSPYHPYPAWDIVFDDVIRERKINMRSVQSFYDLTKEGVEAAQAAGKPFYYAIDIHDPHLALYSFSHRKGKVSTALHGQDKNNPPSRIFKDDEIDMPKFLPDTPLSRKELTAYYNSVRRADDSFGSVMRALKDTGTWDNTLVVFFSDHGMPFPFAKTAMYYHSTHTPLMVRWPGLTRAGTVDEDHVVGTVDILPTLLEAVGIEEPDGLDGRTLAPILKGGTQDHREFAYVMYEENVGGNRQPMRGVTSKDYTYICNLWSDGVRKFATATKGTATCAEIFRLAKEGDETMQERADLFTYSTPEQFFDVNKDADGLNNLIGNPEYRQRIQMHRKQMVQVMKASEDPMGEIYQKRDDKDAVGEYLARLDAEVKVRKSRPALYKRGHAARAEKSKNEAKAGKKAKKTKKNASSAAEGTTLEEHLERNRARAEKNNKPFDEESSTKWFSAKDTNNDGILDEQERAQKVPPDWNK
jgi:N-sulfoglucosamine sulfohydrolase